MTAGPDPGALAARARSPRYEAAGAIYHVMARGDGGRDIFEDDSDRYGWLDRMEEVCGKYGWRIHAYVLMGNHFHFLLETASQTWWRE